MKKKNWNLIIGVIISGILILMIVTGFFYTPYDPNAMNGSEKLSGPSLAHFMGTDNFGRDIFSRVLDGGGTTLLVGLVTVLSGAVVGTIAGAFTGYYGGILDEILMRVNDIITAFPSVLLALIFISVLGSGKYNIMLALGIIFIPSFTRIVRGEFIKNKNLEYVKSAKLYGASDFRIMFVHILPNILQSLLSAVVIGFNNAVLAEASMSYLGIGIQPPDASLGRMLSEAQTYLFAAPWYALGPGLTVIFLIFGVSLIGEGIRKRR
jgi:peptide/nickel transport system permease protein